MFGLFRDREREIEQRLQMAATLRAAEHFFTLGAQLLSAMGTMPGQQSKPAGFADAVGPALAALMNHQSRKQQDDDEED